MSDVPALDDTASHVIKDMVNGTLEAGRKVVVALPQGEPCALLDREQISDSLPMHYRHIGRLPAMRFAKRLLAD